MGIDGYPTEPELDVIRAWRIGKYQGNFKPKAVASMIDHLETIWHWPDFGFQLSVGTDNLDHDVVVLELHTGGWSGNEEIIGELQRTFFWMFYWQKSERGGHYRFEFPA